MWWPRRCSLPQAPELHASALGIGPALLAALAYSCCVSGALNYKHVGETQTSFKIIHEWIVGGVQQKGACIKTWIGANMQPG